MTDDNANLVLEHLKHIRNKVDRIDLEMSDVKSRLSSIEIHTGELQTQFAGQSVRLDRLDERLGRVERRLGLVEV